MDPRLGLRFDVCSQAVEQTSTRLTNGIQAMPSRLLSTIRRFLGQTYYPMLRAPFTGAGGEATRRTWMREQPHARRLLREQKRTAL